MHASQKLSAVKTCSTPSCTGCQTVRHMQQYWILDQVFHVCSHAQHVADHVIEPFGNSIHEMNTWHPLYVCNLMLSHLTSLFPSPTYAA